MIRLVDSSAWIEWLTDGVLAPRLEEEIPEDSRCIVPTIVQYELYKWLSRERGEAAAGEFIAYTRDCKVVGLGTRIAVMAAEIAKMHRLSTADAIIYATMVDCEAELLTCDFHFKDLPGVIYLNKQ